MANYIELYSKNPEDPDYISDQMESTNDFDSYLQQLRNVLFPKIGAIFGAQQMPVDIEAYVFDLGLNASQMEKIINEKINGFCTLARFFPTTVKVTYAKGNVRQIVFVDFAIVGHRGYKIMMT